ncbi:CRISPR system Cascade subunit CasC [Desulfobaculum xiamenense]|uniref:CRISPR system Cascade subunit CasC n=1 Tax=Desulfobaculum xiamenense TaxID=995050 RepID=A0A846QL47_9BACT|nr:type I-E CRISPR-associated protein Cas7/Cse4/CasC [Desulfobaculum xiamenense]NJB67907.1 CRISPR system Cascade subunit CasC [Desulfobaculum xiamenense]
MQKYIQLHVLTSYPASNLNRDDLGRPKTVVMGNSQRLRISSQSVKRAWRTSELFQQELGAEIGVRTKSIGIYVHQALTTGVGFGDAMEGASGGSLPTIKDKAAREIARAIAGVFRANKSAEKGKKDEEAKAKAELEKEPLAHLSRAELAGIAALVEECRESGKTPEKDALELLRRDNMAVDIALFGRMLAKNKPFNIEAAVQVGHPMTVHSVEVEDDFFTAVDDLNRDSTGAGHMGVSEYGAGLFYHYICIDTELLVRNLNGNEELAERAVRALTKACCMISPTGKQNSYASRSYASYCLAERGDIQPRTLAAAYLEPLDFKPEVEAVNYSGCADSERKNLFNRAVTELTTLRENYGKVYGFQTESASFNVPKGVGSLDEICNFITE